MSWKSIGINSKKVFHYQQDLNLSCNIGRNYKKFNPIDPTPVTQEQIIVHSKFKRNATQISNENQLQINEIIPNLNISTRKQVQDKMQQLNEKEKQEITEKQEIQKEKLHLKNNNKSHSLKEWRILKNDVKEMQYELKEKINKNIFQISNKILYFVHINKILQLQNNQLTNQIREKDFKIKTLQKDDYRTQKNRQENEYLKQKIDHLESKLDNKEMEITKLRNKLCLINPVFSQYSRSKKNYKDQFISQLSYFSKQSQENKDNFFIHNTKLSQVQRIEEKEDISSVLYTIEKMKKQLQGMSKINSQKEELNQSKMNVKNRVKYILQKYKQ